MNLPGLPVKMNNKEKRTQTLFEKGLITSDQFERIRAYRSKHLFSLRNEILAMFFMAVLFFTGGSSILIYNNIDSIGHFAILTTILIAIILCFYFSFKQSPGFSGEEIVPVNQLHTYLVLAANLLTGVFIAYMHYQYSVFGTRYVIATLVPTLIYFFSAYYFDHKGVLALAISGLCAVAGFSTNPRALMEVDFSENTYLSYSALGLGCILIAWTFYAEQKELKKHFSVTYHNFSLHIISIACISNLTEYYWFLWMLSLSVALYYFNKLAYKLKSYNFFIFSWLYAYVAFNILLIRLINKISPGDLIIYLSPFYFIGSILFFIKRIKTFRNTLRNDSL